MAERANVRSIDSIADFRARLIEYIDIARVSLGEAHSDVLRVQRWVDETKKNEWSRRHKKCRQQLANARSDLERAKIARPDAHPSMFMDQQRGVAKAKNAMEESERKLANVKRWSRELDREAMLFKGSLNRLDRLIEGDLAKAVVWLEKLVEHLQAYVSTPVPRLPKAEFAKEDAASMRRGSLAEPEEQGADDEPAIEPGEIAEVDEDPPDPLGTNS